MFSFAAAGDGGVVEKTKQNKTIRFEIPGEPQAIRLSDKFDKNLNIKYFGRGLAEGECGASIDRVKANHNGQITCVLGLAEEEAVGFIDLTVACKYKPIFSSIRF